MLEPYSEKDDNFLSSVKAEFDKIQLKQKELLDTIKEKHISIESTIQDLVIKQAEYDTIDKYISDKLRPIHELHNEELQNFLKLNEDKAQANLLESQVEELTNSLAYLLMLLEEKPKCTREKND